MPERQVASVTTQFHFRHQIVHWWPFKQPDQGRQYESWRREPVGANVLYNQIEDE